NLCPRPDCVSVAVRTPALGVPGLVPRLMLGGNYALLVLGKPRKFTIAMPAYICMAVPMLALGAVRWGIQGAAWGALAASVLLAPVNYFLLSRTLKVRIVDLVGVLWRPVTSTAMMVGVLVWMRTLVVADSSELGQAKMLLLLVAIGVVTYSATVLALWHLAKRPDGAERFVLQQLARRLRRAEADA